MACTNLCHSSLSLLSIVGESVAPNTNLNAESQQQGEYNGDSECLFVFSAHIQIVQSYSKHIPHVFMNTFFFVYSNHFEKHHPFFNGRRDFEHVGALRQPVSRQHPPHQTQAKRTE